MIRTERKSGFPDSFYRDIPESCFHAVENGGRVEEISYTTAYYQGNGEAFTKNALVYLPWGYDPEKQYDIMYMIHGGGGTEKELLGGAGEATEMKIILDNMIADGELKPCIVVGCSYNNPYNNNATFLCNHFYEELVKDLIPAVESAYSTYCKETTDQGIKDSRLHRGFGGFSMGSACTWWVFENALDYVGYFLPVSGDSWCIEMKGGLAKTVETVEHLMDSVKKQNKTKEDFCIYCGTGTNDIAYPNMLPMIEEMKKHPDVFDWCDNFKDGNFYFALRDGGWHDQNTVRSIVYNGLPKFFG